MSATLPPNRPELAGVPVTALPPEAAAAAATANENAAVAESAAAASATAHAAQASSNLPATLTAVQKLEQSRERMREFLDARSGKHARSDAHGGTGPQWLQKLKNNAVVGTVIDTAAGWWERHPLRSVLAAGEGAVQPFVRRHPLAVVAGGLVLGALVYRTRIFRRVLRPTLFAGLVSQVAARLIERIPLDTVLDNLSRVTGRARAHEEEAAAAAAQAVSQDPVIGPYDSPSTQRAADRISEDAVHGASNPPPATSPRPAQYH